MAEENQNKDFTKESEVDIAYQVLSQEGKTMNYKDLVLRVIELKHKPVQSLSAAISEVYTLINMDSRFHYEGEQQWGLTEWNPPEVKRHVRSSAGTTKAKTDSKESRRREKLLEGIQD
jgi:DNA-directed RNA polymerase subunit delta